MRPSEIKVNKTYINFCTGRRRRTRYDEAAEAAGGEHDRFR